MSVVVVAGDRLEIRARYFLEFGLSLAGVWLEFGWRQTGAIDLTTCPSKILMLELGRCPPFCF